MPLVPGVPGYGGTQIPGYLEYLEYPDIRVPGYLEYLGTRVPGYAEWGCPGAGSPIWGEEHFGRIRPY